MTEWGEGLLSLLPLVWGLCELGEAGCHNSVTMKLSLSSGSSQEMQEAQLALLADGNRGC